MTPVLSVLAPQYTPLHPCFNRCCRPTPWPPCPCLTPELLSLTHTHTQTHTHAQIRTRSSLSHPPAVGRHSRLQYSDRHGNYEFILSGPQNVSFSWTASDSSRRHSLKTLEDIMDDYNLYCIMWTRKGFSVHHWIVTYDIIDLYLFVSLETQCDRATPSESHQKWPEEVKSLWRWTWKLFI